MDKRFDPRLNIYKRVFVNRAYYGKLTDSYRALGNAPFILRSIVIISPMLLLFIIYSMHLLQRRYISYCNKRYS